ncbi:MAG: hypothetical protein EAX96_20780 [Candidatus Lokiarchaeota archaeon]|nr:hypothetical protein [Candidatus Lokiarchaeota archaeon]
MRNIVDFDKFIKKLEITKCDFTEIDTEEIKYGYTIERILKIMLECLTNSLEIWVTMPKQDIDYIINTLLEKMQEE